MVVIDEAVTIASLVLGTVLERSPHIGFHGRFSRALNIAHCNGCLVFSDLPSNVAPRGWGFLAGGVGSLAAGAMLYVICINQWSVVICINLPLFQVEFPR